MFRGPTTLEARDGALSCSMLVAQLPIPHTHSQPLPPAPDSLSVRGLIADSVFSCGVPSTPSPHTRLLQAHAPATLRAPAAVNHLLTHTQAA